MPTYHVIADGSKWVTLLYIVNYDASVVLYAMTCVTRDRSKKLPKFFKSCPKSGRGNVYFKEMFFKIVSSKSNPIFGLLLKEKKSPKTFKNCPIWAHRQ